MPQKQCDRECVRAMLAGGDRRTIGRVNDVLQAVGRETVAALVDCLWDADECVRMRAADALEKISLEQVGLVQPYKDRLIGLSAEVSQQEVRWHLALMIPRLQLTASECRRTGKILRAYLDDKSSIVRTCAMQGLAGLTEQSAGLRDSVIELVRELSLAGTPAMRARGRKLLQKLQV